MTLLAANVRGRASTELGRDVAPARAGAKTAPEPVREEENDRVETRHQMYQRL